MSRIDDLADGHVGVDAEMTQPNPAVSATNNIVDESQSSRIVQVEDDGGVLSSLRLYDRLRAEATDVVREEGSNVDRFVVGGKDIGLCHLSTILPFTHGIKDPSRGEHEDMVAVALAAHHLNTGDGTLVPQVAGLNERCDIRFTIEVR